MSSQHVLTPVPVTAVRGYWPQAKTHLLAAIDLSGGRWTAEYVLAALVLGEQTLWLMVDENQVVEGAVTTGIVHYPERTALALHFMGGNDFDVWYPEMFNTLVEFAHENGCSSVESNARFGFWKWFEPSGFTKDSAFYELRL